MDGDYIVTEVCPHCENEIEMRWSVEQFGYRAYCPVCGKRLMLCDACQHPNGEYSGDCNYDSRTDTCKFNKVNDVGIRVETAAGTLIARESTFGDAYPGIFVDLRRPDADQDLPLVLVEYADDTDIPDQQPKIITRVWGDAVKDEYTGRVVHKNIEEYFKMISVDAETEANK